MFVDRGPSKPDQTECETGLEAVLIEIVLAYSNSHSMLPGDHVVISQANHKRQTNFSIFIFKPAAIINMILL